MTLSASLKPIQTRNSTSSSAAAASWDCSRVKCWSRLRMLQGDRIVLRNVTEEQIKAYPKFDNDDKAYRELEGSTTISLTEMK